MTSVESLRARLAGRPIARWIGMAFLIGTLAMAVQPQTAQSQADFGSLLDALAPAVVQVETPLGSGSGFVVEHRPDQGETSWGIVTGCHVVADAPRAFDGASSPPTAWVSFPAWAPSVRIEAAVVQCDAATDSALLQPLDDEGNVTTLPKRLGALARMRGNPELARFPYLWFGDSDRVRPLQGVLSVGYPGPFAEFNAVQGRISGKLPRLFITAQDGPIYQIERLAVHRAADDAAVSFDDGDVLSYRTFPAMQLEQFPQFARRILETGHGLILQGNRMPAFDRTTGWEVVGVDGDVVQVRERPVIRNGAEIGGFEPPTDRGGSVDQERTFFRVDAPLGSGFSGAPVFNLSGQVVGMVEWGISTEGGHFANPARHVRQTLFESP